MVKHRTRSNGSNSHGNSSTGSGELKSKEELWKGALEKDIGDGTMVQMIGMDSPGHTVYARVIGDGSSTSPQITIGRVVEVMVDEEWSHIIKEILEKKERIQNDSRPPADQLLRLGAVWLIDETAYTKGEDLHAHRLGEKDAATIPNWNDMTIRIYYMPSRFHVAHEVDWAKYCRGLLIGGDVEVSIGDEKPSVPVKGLPDSKDGVIVYEDENLGYAILNKPEGVPGHGTKANHIENVQFQFHEALKELWPTRHRKIHVTLPQRIDAELQGLIAVSTKKEFSTYFAEHLAPGHGRGEPLDGEGSCSMGMHKKYRCLICIKDEESLDKIQNIQETATIVTHYFDPKCASPTVQFVRHRPKSSAHAWTECRMQITRVGNDRLRAASVSSLYDDVNEPEATLAHRLWRPDSAAPAEELGVKYVMELEIEDLTGRPHQIRGQLAELGVPLVGDALYGGGVCETGAHRHLWKRMALQCCELSFLEPRWEESEGKGDEKATVLVPSDRKCIFRLKGAWWAPYLEEYGRSVLPIPEACA